jgi:hypothetical protein
VPSPPILPPQPASSWPAPPKKESAARRSGLFARRSKEADEVARLRAWIEQTQCLDAERIVAALAGAEAEAAAIRSSAEAEAKEIRAAAEAEAKEIRKAAADSVKTQRADTRDAVRLAEQSRKDLQRHQGELAALQAQMLQLRGELAVTEETVMLQQVGVYSYQHPLKDAISYRTRLDSLQAEIKQLAGNGRAVLSISQWTVNGSTAVGTKMLRDFSKLMLRAYNAEADQAVRTMRPHRLPSLVDRLYKTRETIAKLGATMQIRISDEYHDARIRELHLTADYLQKKEEEKEAQREARTHQREEEAAQREYARERAKLEKERGHVQSALQRLHEGGNSEGAAELEAKLAELEEALRSVEARAANIRTGYVYVISNIGAFGPGVVKIGLTRRLDPSERIYELSGASVPFRFDIHALIFSDDAVGLETRLHQRFADQRVNRVNTRREFFHVSPAEVRTALQDYAGQHLVEFTDEPEALEWRASRSSAPTA